MAGKTFTVTVQMSHETATQLQQSGFSLYAFLAVESSNQAAKPLIWRRVTQLLLNTPVSWSDTYQAYTATRRELDNGSTVSANSSTTIQPDEVLTIDSTGTGPVTKNGQLQGSIAILSNTTATFNCGIAEQDEDGSFPLVCAQPLFSNDLALIKPLPQILLLLATQPGTPGTVWETAYGPALLIDMGDTSERQVTYDIEEGWSWGDLNWGTSVSALSPLAECLIQSSPRLQALALNLIASLRKSFPAE